MEPVFLAVTAEMSKVLLLEEEPSVRAGVPHLGS